MVVILKLSQVYKALTSKVSKMEYKSSSAAELEGGQYHKPIYTLTLTGQPRD